MGCTPSSVIDACNCNVECIKSGESFKNTTFSLYSRPYPGSTELRFTGTNRQRYMP